MVADAEHGLVFTSDMPLEKLEVSQKVQLLIRLRRKLQSLVLSLEAPSAPIGAELPTSSSEVSNLTSLYPTPPIGSSSEVLNCSRLRTLPPVP
jgi:hypothetical protein